MNTRNLSSLDPAKNHPSMQGAFFKHLKKPEIRIGIGLTLFVVCTVTSLSGIPGGLAFFKVIHISNNWMYVLGGISTTSLACDGVIFIWLMTEGYLLCKRSRKIDTLPFDPDVFAADVAATNRVLKYCSDLTPNAVPIYHLNSTEREILTENNFTQVLDRTLMGEVPSQHFCIGLSRVQFDNGSKENIYFIYIKENQYESSIITKPDDLKFNSLEDVKVHIELNAERFRNLTPYQPQSLKDIEDYILLNTHEPVTIQALDWGNIDHQDIARNAVLPILSKYNQRNVFTILQVTILPQDPSQVKDNDPSNYVLYWIALSDNDGKWHQAVPISIDEAKRDNCNSWLRENAQTELLQNKKPLKQE